MRCVWVLSDFGDDADSPEGVGTFVFSSREKAEAFVCESLERGPFTWERHWCSSRTRSKKDDGTYYIELLQVDDDGEPDATYDQLREALLKEFPPRERVR